MLKSYWFFSNAIRRVGTETVVGLHVVVIQTQGGVGLALHQVFLDVAVVLPGPDVLLLAVLLLLVDHVDVEVVLLVVVTVAVDLLLGESRLLLLGGLVVVDAVHVSVALLLVHRLVVLELLVDLVHHLHGEGTVQLVDVEVEEDVGVVPDQFVQVLVHVLLFAAAGLLVLVGRRVVRRLFLVGRAGLLFGGRGLVD